MKMRIIPAVSTLALVILLAACSKSPKANSGTPAPQAVGSSASPATPAMPAMSGTTAASSGQAAVVADLGNALKSGNVAQIENAFVTTTPAEVQAVAAVAKLESVKTQVVQLATEKLGSQASSLGALVEKIAPTSGIFPTLASLKTNPLVISGETAVLNQGKSLAKVYFAQEAGTWKVDLQKTLGSYYPDAATAASKLSAMTGGFGQASTFLKQVESGLNDGSVKSFGDIQTLAAKFEAAGLPDVNNVKNLLHF